MPDAPHPQRPAPLPNPLERLQRERSVFIRLVRAAFFILLVTVAMLLVLQQSGTPGGGDAPAGGSRSTINTPIPRPPGGGSPLPDAANPASAASDPRILTLDAKSLSLLTQIRDHLSESSSVASMPGIAVAVNWYAVLGAAIIVFIIVVLVDVVTPNKRIAALSGVFLGTLTGILATVALSFVIDLVVRTWMPTERGLEAIRPILATIKVMLGISLCYLAISTVLQTQDQFRLVIPYVEFSKQFRGVRPNLLDTSALIDARISEVAATGLIQSSLVVPRFVVAELQLLADSGDRLKRGRGRRGLDVITRLQRLGTVDVIIDETPVQALGVDQMLVELAEKLGARIVTTDLGLARVAQIKGLAAINLHDLANSLRPALVPGEQIAIRLVKTGEQPGQGVGYLDDGTMVVAEGGAPHIGEEVPLLVTSTMQTTAGRLVFARPLASPEAAEPSTPELAGGPDAPIGDAGPELDSGPTHPNAIQGASAHGAPGSSVAGPSAPRTGPFPPKRSVPPKPPARRGSGPSTPRNPRRWPPAP